ncbi:MAG: hypothetical protein U0354_16185 [Candidatus Sericytochromatia bacterium]
MFFGRNNSAINDSKIALDSRIEVHDKSQFEVKFDYNLLNFEKKKPSKTSYSIEAYFFIPRSLGISSFNYSKNQFYNDLHANIRFKTPEMSFNDVNDETNRYSPLRILRQTLSKLKNNPNEEMNIIAINEAKLFGCLISGFLKEGTKQIVKLINQATYYKNISNSHNFIKIVQKEIKVFVEDTINILEKYRSIRNSYEENFSAKTVLTNLKLVDEFITYRFENSLASIYMEIENLSNLKSIDCKNIFDYITNIANKESQYRVAQNFICFKNSTSVNYEYYAYRFSAIKKHVFQVLYLDVNHIKNEKKYRNMVAIIGAAFASLLYLPAQALLVVNSSASFTVLFLIIVAYIFKDRAKEISREIILDKLLDKFHNYFPDNDLIIQDPTNIKDVKKDNKTFIGKCKEFMRFIQKDKVKKDIIKLRNLNHVVDIDEERFEEVIYYRKDVKLHSKRILNAHTRRNNIKDIIRFNINEFLDKMDNATGKIRFYDIEKNIFTSLKAPKVYHINIVFKYTIVNASEPSYQRIRVVLDKNGIVRIEEVIPRSKFSTGTGQLIEEKFDEEILSYDFESENESINS